MLERVDRMQLAVRNLDDAEATFAQLFAAETNRDVHSDYLQAQKRVLSLGESELELCCPTGAGPTQDFLDRRGEGLMRAGYATSRLEELTNHLTAIGVPYHRDHDQIYLHVEHTYGFPMVISSLVERRRVGRISFFYEATHTLDTDWKIVAKHLAKLFQLDREKFSEIGSARFGYQGTLTLFDPPHRLDRIELSQAMPGTDTTMRRFVDRHGDSLYMCYVECDDVGGLRDHLLASNASLTARSGAIEDEKEGLWVHPKSTHGMLLGISRTMLGWEWSGRPELVPPLA